MPFDGKTINPAIRRQLDGIGKVIALLGSEDNWCKSVLRSSDGRRCILGAMRAADAAILLKEPILDAIREVTGRNYLRIEMFNDNPATTYPLVMQVLRQTEQNIAAEI